MKFIFAIKTDACSQEWEQSTPFTAAERDQCAREFAADERIPRVCNLDSLIKAVEMMGGFITVF